MKYSNFRHKIRSGDVLAWTHRGWKTWYDIKVQLVRMWTRSEYSHVGIAWVIGGRVFVLEAVSSGVRIMPLSELLPYWWISRPKWNERIQKRAMKAMGKSYSEFQAVLAGFNLLERGKDDFWQCAEYVSYVLNLPIEYGLTPAAIVTSLIEKEGRVAIWLQND